MCPKRRFPKNRKNLFFTKLHNGRTLTQQHWRLFCRHILWHIGYKCRILITWTPTMLDLITSTNFNAFTPSMQCTISIGLMGDTYVGLCLCEEACRTSPLSRREYISWLFFVCQPDMPLWLSSGLIMLTWENSIIRLQLVFWDYSIIPEPRPADAPLALLQTSSNNWDGRGEEPYWLRACCLLVNQIPQLHLSKAFDAAQYFLWISLYCSDKRCGDGLRNNVAPEAIKRWKSRMYEGLDVRRGGYRQWEFSLLLARESMKGKEGHA